MTSGYLTQTSVSFTNSIRFRLASTECSTHLVLRPQCTHAYINRNQRKWQRLLQDHTYSIHSRKHASMRRCDSSHWCTLTDSLTHWQLPHSYNGFPSKQQRQSTCCQTTLISTLIHTHCPSHTWLLVDNQLKPDTKPLCVVPEWASETCWHNWMVHTVFI